MPEMKHFQILRMRLFVITVVLSIGMAFALALAAWSLAVSHNASVDKRNLICNSQNKANDAIRRVLILAANISAARKDGTENQKISSANFYRRALKLVTHVPCK